MDITNKLITILQMVNDWLKFAEAKNAVLLTFSGAGITAIVTYISTSTNTPNSLRIGLIVSVVFLCISSLVCALSFLPKTDIEYFIWAKSKPSRKSISQIKDTDNFYFFNSLKKYEPSDLLESMNRIYFQGQIQTPYKREDLDIANQIIINSEIASTKFTFFRFALWILIFSIFITLVSLLISLILYKKL